VGAPYASRPLFFHAVIALSVAFIAMYRSALYQLPAPAWALAAAVGFLGFFVPLSLPARVRGRLLGGTWPLVVVLPFVGIVLSPRLLPSPLMVGPFLFCAGASFSTCLVVLSNRLRRKRALERSLDQTNEPEASVQSRLETYFAAGTPIAEGSSNRSKALVRALRAQAWLPSSSRRAHAAALLREAVEFDRDSETELILPFPSEALRGRAAACHASIERIRPAYLSAAAKLEGGERIVRWKSWLWSLTAPIVDAQREWVDAIDRLARRQGVPRPDRFRAWRRELARYPLTDGDVTPPWSFGARLAKAATVAVAMIVLSSALLSTATAQTPLDDSRRLPVIAGPSGESRIEPRLSRVVSSLARRRAEVRCWSREDWQRLAAQRTSWIHRSQRRLGRWSAYASKDHKRVQLSPALCASLARVTYERLPVESDRWPAALALSVGVLAHEAQHISGVSNEVLAECYGMQSITLATQALGRPEREGRYLASLYWEDAYHKHRNPAYVSEECRDGGRLDLRSQVDVWP
jgi:hypothetical protein